MPNPSSKTSPNNRMFEWPSDSDSCTQHWTARRSSRDRFGIRLSDYNADRRSADPRIFLRTSIYSWHKCTSTVNRTASPDLFYTWMFLSSFANRSRWMRVEKERRSVSSQGEQRSRRIREYQRGSTPTSESTVDRTDRISSSSHWFEEHRTQQREYLPYCCQNPYGSEWGYRNCCRQSPFARESCLFLLTDDVSKWKKRNRTEQNQSFFIILSSKSQLIFFPKVSISAVDEEHSLKWRRTFE